MALYGSLEGIQALLATEQDDWPASQQARMTSLRATVSRLIEAETGAVFGDETPETVVVEQYGTNSLLFLPRGLRSLTSVAHSPTWDGTAWVDAITLDADQYRLAAVTPEGVYRAIRRIGTAWSGIYLVAGVWEDRIAAVPEEIHYLTNYLCAEIFKKQTASPSGFVGPDGAVVPVRNTFSEPEVKKILDLHRVNAGLVFF